MFLPLKVIDESLLGQVSEDMTHHLSMSELLPQLPTRTRWLQRTQLPPSPCFPPSSKEKALVILDEGLPHPCLSWPVPQTLSWVGSCL